MPVDVKQLISPSFSRLYDCLRISCNESSYNLLGWIFLVWLVGHEAFFVPVSIEGLPGVTLHFVNSKINYDVPSSSEKSGVGLSEWQRKTIFLNSPLQPSLIE